MGLMTLSRSLSALSQNLYASVFDEGAQALQLSSLQPVPFGESSATFAIDETVRRLGPDVIRNTFDLDDPSTGIPGKIIDWLFGWGNTSHKKVDSIALRKAGLPDLPRGSDISHAYTPFIAKKVASNPQDSDRTWYNFDSNLDSLGCANGAYDSIECGIPSEEFFPPLRPISWHYMVSDGTLSSFTNETQKGDFCSCVYFSIISQPYFCPSIVSFYNTRSDEHPQLRYELEYGAFYVTKVVEGQENILPNNEGSCFAANSNPVPVQLPPTINETPGSLNAANGTYDVPYRTDHCTTLFTEQEWTFTLSSNFSTPLELFPDDVNSYVACIVDNVIISYFDGVYSGICASNLRSPLEASYSIYDQSEFKINAPSGLTFDEITYPSLNQAAINQCYDIYDRAIHGSAEQSTADSSGNIHKYQIYLIAGSFVMVAVGGVLYCLSKKKGACKWLEEEFKRSDRIESAGSLMNLA